jgi:Flp pilus assembly protein TadG
MKMKILKKNQEGATVVEFAIIAPLLLLLIFGAIDFSILLYNKAMITNASREGARAGVVFDLPNRKTQAEIEQIVNDYCEDHLISFGDLNYNVNFNNVPCTTQGDPITVSVTCDFDFLFIPIGPIPLNADTVMMCE